MKRVLRPACFLGACLVVSFGARQLRAIDSPPSPSKDIVTAVKVGEPVGPKIQFESPVYDFGKVLCGEVVKHEFVFRNTGSGILVITDVHSSCGCTSATNTTKSVAPGNKGVIAVEFNTIHFSGPVTKAVTVKSTDTNQPAIDLQLKGNVWRPIEISPASAAFMSRMDSPSNEVRVVKILNKAEKPLVLSALQIDKPTIAAELKTNQFGKEYELVVRLVPPLGAGNTFGQITLKTSSPEIPVINVPVFAIAQVRK